MTLSKFETGDSKLFETRSTWTIVFRIGCFVLARVPTSTGIGILVGRLTDMIGRICCARNGGTSTRKLW